MNKILLALAAALVIGGTAAMPDPADARHAPWRHAHSAEPHWTPIWDHNYWGTGSFSHGGWGLGGVANGALVGGASIAVTPYGPYPYGPYPHGMYP